MNQIKKADKITLAKSHFDNFLESAETAYLAQKTGYDGKNRDEEIEEHIIQGSFVDASDSIANACITLQHTRCKIRTAYFKVAILFYETLKSLKYAYMMANIAMDQPDHKKFFLKKAREHRDARNEETTVYFDIEVLFDEFDILLKD